MDWQGVKSRQGVGGSVLCALCQLLMRCCSLSARCLPKRVAWSLAPLACSVTGLAALQLTLGSLLFEGATLTAAGKRGVFGWLADRHYLPRVLYLAVVPGIVGHTGKRWPVLPAWTGLTGADNFPSLSSLPPPSTVWSPHC
jgi:hypothetical protein